VDALIFAFALTPAATSAIASAAAFAAPAPAAAPTITTSTAPTATSSSTIAALRTRAGFVDGQVATLERMAIQGVRRCFGLFPGGHGDKGESSGTATHAIQHEVDFVHGAVLGEEILEFVLGDVVGKISYEQLIAHGS
jgi:hypothetical protein